ncbi:MAG: GPW/gp25 family protein [Proteobacteria bacterium]|nr:GPW/gp25 family protein [Pseudomonadota bacterium]
MAQNYGSDLFVVPWLTAHDAAEIDIVTKRKGRTTQVVDPDTATDRVLIAQALILRLLTPRGTLESLGHLSYGSRLHELIGRRKTEALRNLCRLYVLETVAQEPRVEAKAVRVIFDRKSETPSSFVFTLEVRPVNEQETLTLSLEVSI